MINDTNNEELLDVFFNDSSTAQILVNSSKNEIIQINEALIKLLELSKEETINSDWKVLDDEQNHYKYKQYLKELTNKESVEFILKTKQSGQKIEFDCSYQVCSLGGELYYLGKIIPLKSDDFSDKLSDIISDILAYQDNENKKLLGNILVHFNLEFLATYRYINGNLVKENNVGNDSKAKDLIGNYKGLITKKVESNNKFEISKANYSENKNTDVLLSLNLGSICVYPIRFQKQLYGILIAGSQKPFESWNATRSTLQILTHQIKFNLFDKLVEKQREIDSQNDKLTGLLNRKSLKLVLDQLEFKELSEHEYVSYFNVTIDSLKLLNDEIGSKLTDEAIRIYARQIDRLTKRKGRVFRSAGDSFTILMNPHIDRGLAKKLAKKLIATLQTPILLSNAEEVTINSNIGISIYPGDGQTISNLKSTSDLALLQSKDNGVNTYEIYKHSETGLEIRKKTEMEQRLKLAIANKELEVYYQPTIQAATEKLVGFEALVRWNDDVYGMISPEIFIPIAEETGLIHQLGELVTIKACNKLKDWHNWFSKNLIMSINLSPLQLLDANIKNSLERIINSSGVHPKFVDFEITESMDLKQVPNLLEVLSSIVDIGCSLSIDDFGTGHSSLDQVTKIPAKRIKIDQSFVSKIGINPEDEAILDTTIDMAKRLNRLLVAEGVETESQRDFLVKREVNYLQGYLFSKPLPEKEVDKLLKEYLKIMKNN